MTVTTTDAFLIMADSHRCGAGTLAGQATDARREAPSSGQVRDGTWTVKESEVFVSADDAKEFIETAAERGQVGGTENQGFTDDYIEFCQNLVANLVQAGLEEIDWHEIARHYLGKLDEG